MDPEFPFRLPIDLELIITAYAVDASRVNGELYYLVGEFCTTNAGAPLRRLIRLFWTPEEMVAFESHHIAALGLVRACDQGHLGIAEWLVTSFDLVRHFRAKPRIALDLFVPVFVRVPQAVNSACCRGDLETLQWLVGCFGLTAADLRSDGNEALIRACTRGQIHVVRWLVSHFGLTVSDVRAQDNRALRAACQGGQLEMAWWLVGRFPLFWADACAKRNQALRRACVRGHLEVAQWLVERFGLTAENVRSVGYQALRGALAKGHQPVVEWLRGRFGADPDRTDYSSEEELREYDSD